MQVVILCSGKGTRMGELTRNTPKPLLKVQGKSLLEHKLERLPDIIDEIILPIGYLGEQIREKIGNEYHGKPVHYIEDTQLTGTAHTLWLAKNILRGRFLVMMGDDVYDTRSLEEASQHDFSIVGARASRTELGSRIVANEDGFLKAFASPSTYMESHSDGGLICTGLYSLTKDIFNYEPVKLELKDEWGLPQTLLVATKDHPVHIIETDFWISISSPEDLAKAEEILRN